ncbi:MAG TPA: TadA family conjugal transfer-associated ATPase [Candidatus Lustribacter sp.]|nr:TadA family conjugal transfer-associated ATPase [Candidatus Lustribacter sp.]
MTVAAAGQHEVWAHIRAGRGPDTPRVAGVVAQDEVRLGRSGTARRLVELSAGLLGTGPLEPLLGDPAVTDLAVNGDGTVWVDRGDGLQPVDTLGGHEAVRALAVRLARLAGRRLDETCPYVDGQLPSGVRLHAILPPLVAGGAHICLRIPAARPIGLDELQARGTLSELVDEVLRGLVARRVSFVVTGGTGAGKTTLLAALLGASSPSDRIVVVEDARELTVDHPHVVRLEARQPNVEGAGEVTLTTLVRQALRMRPDRLVVGEVRGAEVRELLAALNTGHDGGCGTLHANSPADVVARFEALGALAGLGSAAVHAQLLSAVQAVVHVRRDGRHRFVESIGMLTRSAHGGPAVEVALRRHGRGWVRGPVWEALATVSGVSREPSSAPSRLGEPC